MNIISIDPSMRSTGVYCRVNGKEYSYSLKNPKRMTREKVLESTYSFFNALLCSAKYAFGLIEGYAYNTSNRQGLYNLIEMVGVIRLCCSNYSVPLVTIGISTWKAMTIKHMKKNNKNQKLYYIETVATKYGKRFSTTDEADAYLIYTAAKDLCKKTKGLSDAQRKIKKEIITILEGKSES